MPFVEIFEEKPHLILDVHYATPNNFMHEVLYKEPRVFVVPEVKLAIDSVVSSLKQKGLGLKIYDGYRPISVQQRMWDKIQDDRYVANPKSGKGRHIRGTAVDVTLVDLEGNELEMPTPFDWLDEKAHSDNMNVSEKALEHRSLLKEVMEKEGLMQLPTEWWHFDLVGWQDDKRFPVCALEFSQL